MRFLRRMFSALGFGAMAVAIPTSQAADVPLLDQTPDHPVSFGFKTNWFAVRTGDAAKVIATLGLAEPQPANWNSGLTVLSERRLKPDENKYVFISPPVRGWALVIGSALPYPERREGEARKKFNDNFEHLFTTLSEAFPEVHFFGSYRVVEFVAWARSRDGRIERIAALAEGDVIANFGNLTPEERSLGLLDVSGLSLEQAALAMRAAYESPQSERRYLVPDEETPLLIAEAWGGINPDKLNDANLPHGVGILAILPVNLRN